MTVPDMDRSADLYSRVLNPKKTSDREVWAPEHEHFEIGFLKYEHLRDGRPALPDLKRNDIAHWQTSPEGINPEGHIMKTIGRGR